MSDSENDTESDTAVSPSAGGGGGGGGGGPRPQQQQQQQQQQPPEREEQARDDRASASPTGRDGRQVVNGHLHGHIGKGRLSDEGGRGEQQQQRQEADEMQEIPITEHDTRSNSDATDAVSGGPAGNIVINKSMDLSERVQSLRNWGVNKLIKTKQKVKEKLGRTHSRTVDRSLEDRIDSVRTQRSNYLLLVANNQRAIEQLGQLLLVLRYSGTMHADLARTERALTMMMLEHSAQELGTAAHLEGLIGKLAGTARTLETLVSKTFDDLLGTVRAYEEARVELDAYQTETERLVAAAGGGQEQARLREMRDSLEQSRLRYEASKGNLEVKLDLLEEHKNRVIERELANGRQAWRHYYWQCYGLLSQAPPDERAHLSSRSDEEGAPGDPVRH